MKSGAEAVLRGVAATACGGTEEPYVRVGRFLGLRKMEKVVGTRLGKRRDQRIPIRDQVGRRFHVGVRGLGHDLFRNPSRARRFSYQLPSDRPPQQVTRIHIGLAV